MFKRANKITALLVAAASVISIVPAMAANTTRLGTKEGTIQNAVAFNNGKYVYEGYKTDDADKSVYYNAGDKDKDLTTLTDADLMGSYSTKYAFANDGSDQYLVDLSSGSISDENAVEDGADNSATKLKTALKKTDRYGDLITVTSANLGYVNENATGVLPGVKFGDVWYQYGITTTSSDAAANVVGGKLYGYTNTSGKYIDASNIANVYAYSSLKKKVVKVGEFNDTDVDTKLKVVLNSAPTYLTQDKDYIYQKVNVTITDTNTITTVGATAAEIAQVNTELTAAQTAYNTAVAAQLSTLNTAVTTATGDVTTAQSALDATKLNLASLQTTTTSTVDVINTAQAAVTTAQATLDAKKAALVTAQAALDAGVTDSSSLTVKKATLTAAQAKYDRLTASGATVAPRTATYIQKISKVQGDTKDEAYLPKTVASYELTKGTFDCGDADDAVTADGAHTSYQVTNGTLFAIKNTGSNVKVTTMKLVKDKVKFLANSLPTNYDIDDKVDVYFVEQGDDDDQDVKATAGVSVDVNGNIWAINDSKIYKFESGEFKEKFTCDSSIDSLDVYDEKNLIAWEDDGDVYTTVNEGTAKTQSESTAVAPTVVTGWVKGTDGTWTFNDATGAKVTSKWINVGGAWYFLKADGIMATGWYNDGGTWYYLNGSGAMATGWLNDNGTWYYLNASGAMLANTTVDGYKLGASGAWVK